MSKNTNTAVNRSNAITSQFIEENMKAVQYLMCKVQNVLVELGDDPEDLDVALKNMEKDIPKWLHPEVFKMVRRGITRIRMQHLDIDETINMLDAMIENCNEKLRELDGIELNDEDEHLLESDFSSDVTESNIIDAELLLLKGD